MASNLLGARLGGVASWIQGPPCQILGLVRELFWTCEEQTRIKHIDLTPSRRLAQNPSAFSKDAEQSPI